MVFSGSPCRVCTFSLFLSLQTFLLYLSVIILLAVVLSFAKCVLSQQYDGIIWLRHSAPSKTTSSFSRTLSLSHNVRRTSVRTFLLFSKSVSTCQYTLPYLFVNFPSFLLLTKMHLTRPPRTKFFFHLSLKSFVVRNEQWQ